jgi:hypothetical protein
LEGPTPKCETDGRGSATARVGVEAVRQKAVNLYSRGRSGKVSREVLTLSASSAERPEHYSRTGQHRRAEPAKFPIEAVSIFLAWSQLSGVTHYNQSSTGIDYAVRAGGCLTVDDNSGFPKVAEGSVKPT